MIALSPYFRLLFVAAVAGLLALAIIESRRRPDPAAWCDLTTMSCYERLAPEAPSRRPRLQTIEEKNRRPVTKEINR